MKIEIVKDWDGNECHTESRGRIYVSSGRWQWVVLVDGVADLAFDTKREAKARAEELTAAAVVELRDPARIGAALSGTMIDPKVIGRLGGLVSSKAKARAARANGKKGGRPAIVHAHPIGCGKTGSGAFMLSNVPELVTCSKCKAIMEHGFFAPGLTHADRSALVKRGGVK